VSPARGTAVPVTFFGRTTMVPAGAATLGLLTGAALLPGYLRRVRGGRYEAHIGMPLQAISSGDREADVQRLTQHVMTALEAMISERPAQWYMFRPFWPALPAVEGDV
jgi:KDO2-lipid IV(A) lauroyltransferase